MAMEFQPLVVTRHIHLSNHDTPAKSVSVDQVKQRYAEADAIVVEEHGKFEKPGDPKDSDPGPMVLHGAEWATPIHPQATPARPENRHHVGLMGVDSLEQSKLKFQGYDGPQLQRKKIELADGALVLNHPEYPYIDASHSSPQSLDYLLPKAEAEAFHAVELFNDVGFHGSNPAEVLNWVERNFYSRGLYPSMVGGQDDHGPSPVAKKPSYTIAMVNHRSEAGFMAAVREGRTFVSKSPDARLSLSLNGNSLWEAPSSLVPGRHELKLSLAGMPPGAVVELVRKGEVIARTPASQGQTQLKVPLEVSAAPNGPDYVYLRVWSEPGVLHTVSSAFGLR